MSEKEKIRNLVEIYYDVQDVRICTFNRLREVGEVKGVNPKNLKKLEKEIRDYIEVYVNAQPIWDVFLEDTRGIGAILAGGMISWLDPHKADHISSFWKYCGLHVQNGEAIKRKRGAKLDYNPRMKTFAWKIGDSFIKQRTPFYRDIYDEAKVKYDEKLNHPIKNPKNCPNYEKCMKRLKKAKKPACKLHIHRMAMRKMVKRFLGDLWLVWRKLEGLPTSEPYAIGILKHTKRG